MAEISYDNIKAIILAGSFEFGRFPLMLRVPKVLWPVAGKPAIQRLIDGISRQNIHNIVVCTNFDNELSGKDISAGDIKFLKEKLPRGTGGCLRDAAEEVDSLFVSACRMRAAIIERRDC